MNKTTRIILLCVAGLLIVGGITTAIISLVMDKPVKEPVKNTTAPTTQAGTGTGTKIDEAAKELIELLESNDKSITVEFAYDDMGNVMNEKYYKNGEYCGQRWYYRIEKEDHSILYDAKENEIASSKTVYNTVGSIDIIEEYMSGALVKTTKYEYYEDLRTPKKKTVKDMTGEVELAQVTRYDDTGKKTETISYRDGKEISKVIHNIASGTN